MPAQPILWIRPENELQFIGPFDVESRAVLQLANLSEQRVCFRILTTQPTQYDVRPHHGILHHGTSASIEITLWSNGLKPNATDEHLFRVQYFFVPEIRCRYSFKTLWKYADTRFMMHVTLRCAFNSPAEDVSGSRNDGSTAEEMYAQNRFRPLELCLSSCLDELD